MNKSINVTMPKDWHGVTIEKFQQLYALPQDLAPMERNMRIVSIITGQPLDVIRSVDLGDIRSAMEALTWMSKTPEAPEVFPTVVNYDGVDYNIVTEAAKVTVGEMATLESLSKDNSRDIIANLHLILAAFIKPVDKTLNIDFATRAHTFKTKMSVGVAHPLAFFFSAHYLNSLRLTAHCLKEAALAVEKEAKTSKKKNRSTLFNVNTNGLKWWTKSRAKTRSSGTPTST